MAKVTREHILIAHQQGKSTADIAAMCSVSRQAVSQMRKKYFPQGLPPTDKQQEE